jgi:hypothetical protein
VDAAPPGKNGKSPPPSPTIREALGWLPANTETIIAAVGPFQVEVRENKDDEVMKSSFEELLELQSLSPLTGIAHGAFAKELRGRKVALAVEGARNFRAPKQLGEWLYDGCHILVFEQGLGTAGAALEKTLLAKAKKTFRIGGNQVFVYEQQFEKDLWTFYITRPQENVLLLATERHFLEEVLKRREKRAKVEAAPTRLPDWEAVVGQARFWALHRGDTEHYLDGNDFVFTFTPGSREVVKITCYLKGKEATKTIRRNWTGGSDEADLAPRIKKIRPGVIEATFRLKKRGDSRWEFLFGLLCELGHGIFFC